VDDVRNQAQLITYTDRLGGTFEGLRELLTGPLAGLFGGVHVLPFFDPIDGADAGFDPIDHRAVDPRLGTWDDVHRLGDELPIMADLIVNHVATGSPPFQDFLARGDASEHAGLFLTYRKVFPDGATEQDLLAVYRPRPGLPLTPVILGDRSRRIMWTTFTASQMDIDVASPEGRAYLDGILDTFAGHGIRMVRLDAVGYAVKTAGTSSFMTSDTFAFIDELAERAHERGIEVLVEVHSYWRKQLQIASKVDWVYDFALPPLILHGLYTGNAECLRRWFELRPHNSVTVLDTHDGIGVIDVGPDSTNGENLGLLNATEIDELVEGIHEHSHGASRLATGGAASNVDLYQVNCTYFDALGADDVSYLIARLLQVWIPGVPQIYYVGLLAGHNDVELLHRTGVGRDINRHHYAPEEIEHALARPVVQRLRALLELRNTHPAFDGTWELLPVGAGEGVLAMRWTHGDELAGLRVDLQARSYEVTFTEAGVEHRIDDLADLIEMPS
jgi:sucrose phosphorylase